MFHFSLTVVQKTHQSDGDRAMNRAQQRLLLFSVKSDPLEACAFARLNCIPCVGYCDILFFPTLYRSISYVFAYSFFLE